LRFFISEIARQEENLEFLRSQDAQGLLEEEENILRCCKATEVSSASRKEFASGVLISEAGALICLF